MSDPRARFRRLMGLFRQAPERVDARDALVLLEWVEGILASEGTGALPRQDWEEYLEETRHPRYLEVLYADDRLTARRWAETTFKIVEDIHFDLGDLLAQRAARTPDRVLFQDLGEKGGGSWTYGQILQRVRSNAAVFLEHGVPAGQEAPVGDGPRVALLCENGIDSACCDLACLTHDIFVTPLNVHFGVENLAWIFDRLDITCAVCDHPDRLEKLLAIRERSRRPFVIFALNDCAAAGRNNIHLLEEFRGLLETDRIETILAGRHRRTMREVSTVMFTSGSTGRPKGVSFSQLNLVSKRYGRAAALPAVGRDETLLCYLPLYHTFGRYLEMLGAIFWGGTYVFSGNPSADTLIAQFQIVQPTALISVPIRWVQMCDRILEIAKDPQSGMSTEEAFRHITGDRLYWGLSAAGYLDPKVFRFFHRGGVALCSGFGMTEGTGGLTMTPPDEYVAGSVGVPLPGTYVQFGDMGELEIAGPYIARYLPEEGNPGDLIVEEPDNDRFFIPTGDLFREVRDGHLEIVDRIKDIYKNNRGQTVAPRKVESLFAGVPGIKRTFLAGDGRSYNALLIVPDLEDEVLQKLTGEDECREYFNQIVTHANPDLPSFERVVNFAILDRDFSLEKDELTPKGSYKRKVIEANFRDVIEDLYQTNVQVLEVGDYEVRLPRWFNRDLGVLDDAIVVDGATLHNREKGIRLAIHEGDKGRVRIGDLEYILQGTTLDMGKISRQPMLWLANPALMAFCPCKLGWDTDCAPFAEQVSLPAREPSAVPSLPVPGGVDPAVKKVHMLCVQALFSAPEQSLKAINTLNNLLNHVGSRLGDVIRRRLEALANHPDQVVRCRAYQLLVLDQPIPDYQRFLPAFIESGKPFLDETSFEAISSASIEPRRLLAFRKRLFVYRTRLSWPADEPTRQIFEDLFRLLAEFARHHPAFYNSVREELICWIMHHEDQDLSARAEKEFADLAAWYQNSLHVGFDGLDPKAWEGKISFQEGLRAEEMERLRTVLIGNTFLRQSVKLSFDGADLSLADVGPGGIWVSRILSRYADARYRVSLNTISGKHFDLQLTLQPNATEARVRETVRWYVVLKGYPFGTSTLPNFGCCRPDLGALATAYVSDLTVWEKIREYSSVRGPGTTPPSAQQWHQLMVRAMSVVVKGWRNSGRRIIPGLITPNNLVVPEPDFRKGALQNTLSDLRYYEGPLSLIRPLWRNIIQHTLSHYPWIKPYVKSRWVFESFVEALGVPESLDWFREVQKELQIHPNHGMGVEFVTSLDAFVSELEDRYYVPRPVVGAIDRFAKWQRINAQANVSVRLGTIKELYRLYRLKSYGEIGRYTLFRHTFFKDAPLPLLDIFDRLLVRMFRHPQMRPTQMVELFEFQTALTDPEARQAYNQMAFPFRQGQQQVEVQDYGNAEVNKVVVRTEITDKYGLHYHVSEPTGPAEIGQLYRLFLHQGLQKTISETDRYLVVTDDAEQIVGGAIYRPKPENIVLLDGIVVTQTLHDRGISTAILQDFVTRMEFLEQTTIRTHFYLRRFFQKHGFRPDTRRGGLVRFL